MSPLAVHPFRLLALAGVAATCAMGATAACASYDPNEVTDEIPPGNLASRQFESGFESNANPLNGVSLVLETHCGSLDCHGQLGRPLRIYSGNGLRFVEEGGMPRPGMSGTTDTERQLNYQAVMGLQPELTFQVMNNGAAPETLLLLRKPLGIERHKGSVVIAGGDFSDKCITSWLTGNGQVDTMSCANANK
jgi:hypothetical protein